MKRFQIAFLLALIIVTPGCVARSEEPDEAEAKREACAGQHRCWKYHKSISFDLVTTRCGPKIPVDAVVNCNERDALKECLGGGGEPLFDEVMDSFTGCKAP